jgi:hypothetical protein
MGKHGEVKPCHRAPIATQFRIEEADAGADASFVALLLAALIINALFVALVVVMRGEL